MQLSYAVLMYANVQCLETPHQPAFALPANVKNQGFLKTESVQKKDHQDHLLTSTMIQQCYPLKPGIVLSLKVLCISKDLHMNRAMATRPSNINSDLYILQFSNIRQWIEQPSILYQKQLLNSRKNQKKKNHISRRKTKQGLIL